MSRISKRPKRVIRVYIATYKNRKAVIRDDLRGKAQVRVARNWEIPRSKVRIRLMKKGEIMAFKDIEKID